MRDDWKYEQLSAYLDGELDATESAAIEHWLAETPAARDELAALRRTVERVRALPRAPAPAGLAAQVEELLARRQLLDDSESTARHSRLVIWVRRFAVAAVVTLAAAGGWTLWSPRHARRGLNEIEVAVAPVAPRNGPLAMKPPTGGSGTEMERSAARHVDHSLANDALVSGETRGRTSAAEELPGAPLSTGRLRTEAVLNIEPATLARRDIVASAGGGAGGGVDAATGAVRVMSSPAVAARSPGVATSQPAMLAATPEPQLRIVCADAAQVSAVADRLTMLAAARGSGLMLDRSRSALWVLSGSPRDLDAVAQSLRSELTGLATPPGRSVSPRGPALDRTKVSLAAEPARPTALAFGGGSGGGGSRIDETTPARLYISVTLRPATSAPATSRETEHGR